MVIECYNDKCKKHSCNSGDPSDEGPFCYEAECQFEPLVPAGYRGRVGTGQSLQPMDVRGVIVRSKRFEAWFANRKDLSLQVVANMWRGGTYTSCDYYVELAWDAWCEAINGARL